MFRFVPHICNIGLEKTTFEITVVWDVTPYRLVRRYQHFGGTCFLYLQGRRDIRKYDHTLSSVCVSKPLEIKTVCKAFFMGLSVK
jgi:hypothetical protein